MTISLPSTLPAIPHGSTNEKLIVGKLVADLLAAGFPLSIWDGAEMTVVESTNTAEIFSALASTDEDRIYVHKDGKTPCVLLVWGNDCDIISDYNVSLEPYLAGAEMLADQLDDRS